MTLTVLNVAYPLAEVSEDSVGGAEQVLYALDRALVRQGCRSLVIATEGSRPAGELIATAREEGALDDEARSRSQARTRDAISAVRRSGRIDVVHLHGIDFPSYLPDDGPTLVSLHLPLAWYPAGALRPGRGDLHLHPVSASQAASAPPGARLAATIPNGVDTARFAGSLSKRGFALTLGRICPEKGVHLALQAARMAEMPLLIGGQVYRYAAHEAYFAESVRPLLDSERRFVGPLPFSRKRRFLNAARCLLIPSLAEETSSLVAMEALASGAPVIAFRKGALPDVVDHGRTGFLVESVEEMAEAMCKADTIDPEACRQAARERFSLERMTDAWLAAYRSLACATAGGQRR